MIEPLPILVVTHYIIGEGVLYDTAIFLLRCFILLPAQIKFPLNF